MAFSPVSWWLVTWRARVLDESTGKIETRLAAVADAMEQIGQVGSRPAVQSVVPSGVSFEFWFEAASAREAAGGARVALREACRTAGVGDPAHPSGRPVDVMLMFEELPALHQSEPTWRGQR